jgi:hypothetical protein
VSQVAEADDLDREARNIVSGARAAALPLRIVGGAAIWQRLVEEGLRRRFREVRPPPRDLDLLAPKGTSSAITGYFASRDYAAAERVIAWRATSAIEVWGVRTSAERPVRTAAVVWSGHRLHRGPVPLAVLASGRSAVTTPLTTSRSSDASVSPKSLYGRYDARAGPF